MKNKEHTICGIPVDKGLKDTLSWFYIGLFLGLVVASTVCIFYFDFGNYTDECINFCLNITNNSCDIPIQYLNLEDFSN